MLSEISPMTHQQGDLLEAAPACDSRLMQALDGLNQRYGRGNNPVQLEQLHPDSWCVGSARRFFPSKSAAPAENWMLESGR
jgi:hypothetical protein